MNGYQSILNNASSIGLTETQTGWLLLLFIVVIPSLSLLFNFLKWKSENKNHHLKKEIAQIEKKREVTIELNEKLAEFLLPLKHYLAQSKMIYDTFAINEKNEAKANGENFNTLRHLCEGKKFNHIENQKLQDILALGNKQNELIETKGWKFQDEAFESLLSKYSVHLKLLNIANKTKKPANIIDFSEYTFPIELPGAVQSKIYSIYEEKENLVIKLEKTKRIEKVAIPKYDRHADNYYNETISIPHGDDIKTFMKTIVGGGLICDIGCGSGRDSIHFIKNGYRVLSTEPSKNLANLARNYPFIYIKEISILNMNYRSAFDGIWCCAVLQHIKPNKLNETIFKLSKMVKPCGHVYISYRATASIKERLLEKMSTHKAETVRQLLIKHGFEVILSKETRSTRDGKNKFRSFLVKKLRS